VPENGSCAATEGIESRSQCRYALLSRCCYANNIDHKMIAPYCVFVVYYKQKARVDKFGEDILIEHQLGDGYED